MDTKIQELLDQQERGHEMLVGAVPEKHWASAYQSWITTTQNELFAIDASGALLADWLALPTPCFYDNREKVDPVEFQRAVEARVAFLGSVVKQQLGVKQNQPTPIMKQEESTGKPAIFIGSSKEGIKIARAVEAQLQYHAEVTLWSNGPFGLGEGALESLVKSLRKFDFAALVLTPDDVTESRGKELQSPRDNVVFELGLFMGRIGRFRTFIMYNSDEVMKLPSDLAGVTPATFMNRSDGNVRAQVSPACTLVMESIERLGRFKNELD